jgi:hypothetical protein
MSLRPLAPLLAASCATLGGQSNPGVNLPSSGVGPFRPLVAAELAVASIPPYVFADPNGGFRDPSVVGASDDPASAAVWMYAVAPAGGSSVIVRTRSDDGRSFYGDVADNANTSHPRHVAPLVLSADQPWEGGSVEGPSAIRVSGQVWLYYGAAGGIGLATSTDGLAFAKRTGPVLAADTAVAWETTAPHAPSVAVFPDGTWHMLYGAGNAIGEATSPDGTVWTRAGTEPILTASPVVDPSKLPVGEHPPFDEGGVDDPTLAARTTVDGQLQVRVLFTGYGDPPGTASRASAIGFAARYGASGPLVPQASPVYTAQLHERGPAFFEYGGGSLLYVGEDSTSQGSSPPSAIAGAFAPAGDTLPSPGAFPPTP